MASSSLPNVANLTAFNSDEDDGGGGGGGGGGGDDVLKPTMGLVTHQEASLAFTSLLCLVQALVGQQTVVELRDETSVHGLIVHVDHRMAVSMEGCDLYHGITGKFIRSADQIRLSGSKIRFVHIPDDVEMMETILSKLGSSGKDGKFSKRKLRKDRDAHLRKDHDAEAEETQTKPVAKPEIAERISNVRKRREEAFAKVVGDRELDAAEVLELLTM